VLGVAVGGRNVTVGGRNVTVGGRNVTVGERNVAVGDVRVWDRASRSGRMARWLASGSRSCDTSRSDPGEDDQGES
jgi:hypothetical protein